MNAVMKSQAVLLSAHAVRLCLSVAVASLLGRNLTPADFGFVALIGSIYVIALELLDMGTTATATREAASGLGRERETMVALLSLRRLLAVGAMAGVLVLAASGYVARGGYQAALAVAALGLYALHLQGYQIPFQLRQDYAPVTALQLSTQAGFLCASAVAVKFYAGGAAIALLVVAREVTQAFGMRLMAGRRLGARFAVPWRVPDAARLFRVAWRIGVAGLAYKLIIHVGGFMLWALDSPEAVGTFNAAQRLLLPLSDMAWLFVLPLIAAMSATLARDAGAFRAQLERHLTLLAAVSSLAAVAGWFLAPFVLRLIYGELYASGPHSAIATFRYLSLGYIFLLVIPVLVVAELAQGHGRALLTITASALALNVALNSWAARTYGPEGTALVLFGCEAYLFVILLSRSLLGGHLRPRAAWILYLVPAALLVPLLSWLAPLLPGGAQ